MRLSPTNIVVAILVALATMLTGCTNHGNSASPPLSAAPSTSPAASTPAPVSVSPTPSATPTVVPESPTVSSTPPTASPSAQPSSAKPTASNTPKPSATATASPSPSPTLPPPTAMPVLSKGSKGDAVKVLQQLLGDKTVDGQFGQATWYAVKAYQSVHGLPVTAVVDLATWKSLMSQPPEPAMNAPASARPQLSNGAIGPAVAQLQMYVGGLTVDGHFGAKTLARVKAFQASVGLPQTGVVDTTTWATAISKGPGATTDGLGIDSKTINAAVTDGYSLFTSKKTREMYLLHYDPARGKVLIAAQQQNTTFGGCNKDGCYDTPSGTFTVSRQAGPGEVSLEFKDDAGQPAAMPFTSYIAYGNGGVGVHYDPPANSHACVHEFTWWLAKYVYHYLKPGDTITIQAA